MLINWETGSVINGNLDYTANCYSKQSGSLKQARVFDASGFEWTHVEWCNTETGELKWLRPGVNGQPQFDPVKDCIYSVIVHAPAPLRIVWKEEP